MCWNKGVCFPNKWEPAWLDIVYFMPWIYYIWYTQYIWQRLCTQSFAGNHSLWHGWSWMLSPRFDTAGILEDVVPAKNVRHVHPYSILFILGCSLVCILIHTQSKILYIWYLYVLGFHLFVLGLSSICVYCYTMHHIIHTSVIIIGSLMTFFDDQWFNSSSGSHHFRGNHHIIRMLVETSGVVLYSIWLIYILLTGRNLAKYSNTWVLYLNIYINRPIYRLVPWYIGLYTLGQ